MSFQLKQLIEVVLFLAPKPLEKKEIVKFVVKQKKEKGESVGEETVHEALCELQQEYAAKGIRILATNESVQMVSAPEVSETVRAFFHQDDGEELSPAAIEVLAIVAYQGPISRAQIDALRGVNSAYSIRQLLVRGLIDRQPHPQHPQMYQYSLGAEFLRHLGLEHIDALPKYAELRSLFQEAEVSSDMQEAK